MKNKSKKILIVKIGAIGDVIMCLNTVEYIKGKNKETKVFWLCGKGVEEILRLYGKIDYIISINEEKLFKGNFLERIAEIFSLYRKLWFNFFDLIFIGHSDIRYRILCLPFFCKIKRVFKRNKGRSGIIPGRYHGFEYIRILEGEDYSRKEFFTFPKLFYNLQSEFSFLVEKKARRIVLAPGGAKNYLRDDKVRRWPIDYYVRLANMLIENKFEVILIGAVSDKWCEKYFTNMKLINLIGRTNVKDLIAIFNHSDFLVTHDSGPLHLGVISGIKVIGIFGPTIPYEKLPGLSHIDFVWGGRKLACSPCYDGKDYALCDENKCMYEVTPEIIFEKIIKNDSNT